MIPQPLFIDGLVLAFRCRFGSDLVHCGTLNVGAMGPTTYSIGGRCGVGYNGIRALGEWHSLNPDWRRCPKCVKREDARMFDLLEWGGRKPTPPPVRIASWLRGDQE